MPRFSANLGFLWTDLPLPQAIIAAHTAGFEAVECHWPYEFDPDEVKAALNTTGLTMLGLNTRAGETMGLAALPDRTAEARASIDEAVDYAARIGAGNVHVMAGICEGPAAQACYLEQLRYAAMQAERHNLTILIEPLNRHDAPGYFLRDTAQAAEIIARIGAPNIRLMFDCYHVARTEGDVLGRLETLWPLIGHIQFADTPGRGAPGTGELDFTAIFERIDALGWPHPIGAEYKPGDATVESLGWLAGAKA